jgi:hypothetical protein
MPDDDKNIKKYLMIIIRYFNKLGHIMRKTQELKIKKLFFGSKKCIFMGGSIRGQLAGEWGS